MTFVTGTIIGAVMAAAVVAPVALFSRPRALDLIALQLAAIAAIYVGFGLIDARLSPATAEIVVALAFFGIAVAGRWGAPMVLAVGYLAHGAWDTLHHFGTVSTVIPTWYAPFCLGYDVVVFAFIAVYFARREAT